MFKDLLYFVYTDDLQSFTAKDNLGSLLELYDLSTRRPGAVCRRLCELYGARDLPMTKHANNTQLTACEA